MARNSLIAIQLIKTLIERYSKTITWSSVLSQTDQAPLEADATNFKRAKHIAYYIINFSKKVAIRANKFTRDQYYAEYIKILNTLNDDLTKLKHPHSCENWIKFIKNVFDEAHKLKPTTFPDISIEFFELLHAIRLVALDSIKNDYIFEAEPDKERKQEPNTIRYKFDRNLLLYKTADMDDFAAIDINDELSYSGSFDFTFLPLYKNQILDILLEKGQINFNPDKAKLKRCIAVLEHKLAEAIKSLNDSTDSLRGEAVFEEKKYKLIRELAALGHLTTHTNDSTVRKRAFPPSLYKYYEHEQISTLGIKTNRLPKIFYYKLYCDLLKKYNIDPHITHRISWHEAPEDEDYLLLINEDRPPNYPPDGLFSPLKIANCPEPNLKENKIDEERRQEEENLVHEGIGINMQA